MDTEPMFKRTTDHATIRAWVEGHRGVPVEVTDTGREKIVDIAFDDEIGLPGYVPLSWEDFFERLDGNGLIFHYTDEVILGEEKFAYNFITEDEPSDTHEDETELPEDNELAVENMRNEYAEGDPADEEDESEDEVL